jgi:hypothetical protein
MKIKAKDLVSVWAMSEESDEKKQLTLRLDLESYYKLHAFKQLFNKPVNEMINHLIQVGLDEVISNLPTYTLENDEFVEGIGVVAYKGEEHGPRPDFDSILRDLKSVNYSPDETKEAA